MREVDFFLLYRHKNRRFFPKFVTKELFDSIAMQNAEIRTVAKSLLSFLKYSAKRLFFK